MDEKKLTNLAGKELNADNMSELDDETRDFINNLKIDDLNSFDGRTVVSGMPEYLER